MSPSFIVLYAGAPVQLPGIKMVLAQEATVFASEADGWHAVRRYHLTTKFCRVVELNSFIDQGQNQFSSK